MPRPPKTNSKPRTGTTSCDICGRVVTRAALKRHRDGHIQPQVTLPSVRSRTIHTIDDDDSAAGAEMDYELENDGFSSDDDDQDPDDNIVDDDNTVTIDGSRTAVFRDTDDLHNLSYSPIADDMRMDLDDPPIGPVSSPTPSPFVAAPRRVTVEEVPDDDDEFNVDANGPELPEGVDIVWDGEMAAEDDELLGLDDHLLGLTLEDIINENMEQELADFGQELTDDEIMLLRHFTYKLEHHLTDEAFEDLAWAFPDDLVNSWKVTKARAEWLAKFRPIPYDCCVNSCCCFVGPHADETSCPHCREARYRADGKRARKQFTYIPLIPRLIGFFRQLSMIERLKYRAAYKKSGDGVEDVFDGKLYERLRETSVTINGVELPYKHFEFLRDIALGLSTDGFAPWRRRKKTCWPLLIFNYNLPPDIRFHLEHILCVGVIPGPKKPKDFDSFIWPLVQELMQLAKGVRAFDVSEGELFPLRAYLILLFGDIPAVSLASRMVGHNGVRPCRMCNIHGVKEPNGRTNYVPLNRSRHPDIIGSTDPSVIRCYDPLHLPLRTHEEFKKQAEEVQYASTDTASETLATKYGIKGMSIFFNLSSMIFPLCLPYDFMHLIYENVLKNLVLLWTGKFKDLDEGTGQYQFMAGVWEIIGAATAACGPHIPSSFAASPPNVSDDKQATTADSWSYWLLYIAPVLLENRFPQAVYYNHFMDLVKLIHLCLQFHTTSDDISAIRAGFKSWVLEYERLYYQHNPARARACPVTMHALLHIADLIESAGPVWSYWAFPTERYCGRLQPAIKSRRYPFASIDNYVTLSAQLSHIKVTYGLEEVLTRPRMRKGQLPIPKGCFSHPDYPSCVLLPPVRPSADKRNPIPEAVHEKVLICLSTRFDVAVNIVRRHYDPDLVDHWATVRRLEGGDDMKASSMISFTEDRRDATYVRYDLLVDIHASNRRRRPQFVPKSFYGQLQHILVVRLPAVQELGLEEETTLILAYVNCCETSIRKLRGMEIPYYTKMARHEVVDMSSIQCLVGRIPPASDTRPPRWAVIDRSGNLERSYYVQD